MANSCQNRPTSAATTPTSNIVTTVPSPAPASSSQVKRSVGFPLRGDGSCRLRSCRCSRRCLGTFFLLATRCLLPACALSVFRDHSFTGDLRPDRESSRTAGYAGRASRFCAFKISPNGTTFTLTGVTVWPRLVACSPKRVPIEDTSSFSLIATAIFTKDERPSEHPFLFQTLYYGLVIAHSMSTGHRPTPSNNVSAAR